MFHVSYNGAATISESFALNLWVFVPLTVCSFIIQVQTKFFIVLVQLIEYNFSA